MAIQQTGEPGQTGKRKKKSGGYIFTNKAHSPRGIMGTILGILSLTGIVLTIVLTFRRRGEALLQYGAVLLLCTIFGLVGLGLSVYARLERDKYYLFAYLGILWNLIALIGISLILYAGAYGI
ncbi:MAG: DUF6142 family protein [Lachnospiraceae bacterium]